MTDPPIYLLDANVFVEAARGYYAFDIISSFWDSLIDLAENDHLLSIDRVHAEIKHPDSLRNWADNDFHPWFMPTDEPDVLESYALIMAWAQGESQFNDAAKAEFAAVDNADAWVVAYARTKGCFVVTHEQLAPDVRRKIPIPNVCQQFGVQYTDTFQMLRDLGVRLG